MKKIILLIFIFSLLIALPVDATEKEKAEKQADERFNNISEFGDSQMNDVQSGLREKPDYFDEDDELNGIDMLNVKIWQLFYKIKMMITEFIYVIIIFSFLIGFLLYRVFKNRAKALETTGFLLMTVFPLLMLAIVYFDVIKLWIAV